ncbi:unnamed protein product [Protopolystoma xenopodis]|uniref:Uncharacterized protein n=1 Tax=Protopolystoma xenopodis TaxID=117903 RepID=A0A448XDY9_9PLAT|nr:unnamed protein product [Protopolystoma xenopodis]
MSLLLLYPEQPLPGHLKPDCWPFGRVTALKPKPRAVQSSQGRSIRS